MMDTGSLRDVCNTDLTSVSSLSSLWLVQPGLVVFVNRAAGKGQVRAVYANVRRQALTTATDDFTPSFLHFSLNSTALWDFANSRPVHSLMSSACLVFFTRYLGRLTEKTFFKTFVVFTPAPAFTEEPAVSTLLVTVIVLAAVPTVNARNNHNDKYATHKGKLNQMI